MVMRPGVKMLTVALSLSLSLSVSSFSLSCSLDWPVCLCIWPSPWPVVYQVDLSALSSRVHPPLSLDKTPTNTPCKVLCFTDIFCQICQKSTTTDYRLLSKSQPAPPKPLIAQISGEMLGSA